MSIETLEDALYRVMTDLINAETQFRESLGRLSQAAADEALVDAFRRHHDETAEQISRLEKGFDLIGRPRPRELSKAAAGLIDEAEDAIHRDGHPPATDVMLAAAGRRVERYEIISYSDAVEWARQLGHRQLADLLEQSLEEEEAVDEELGLIAARLSARETA